MPFINVPDSITAATADGTAAGYITVASNAIFYPSTKVWLISDLVAGKQFIITDLVGTTKIGLRAVPTTRTGGVSYGKSDVSAYLFADNTKINVPAQTVPVEGVYAKLPIP